MMVMTAAVGYPLSLLLLLIPHRRRWRAVVVVPLLPWPHEGALEEVAAHRLHAVLAHAALPLRRTQEVHIADGRRGGAGGDIEPPAFTLVEAIIVVVVAHHLFHNIHIPHR